MTLTGSVVAIEDFIVIIDPITRIEGEDLARSGFVYVTGIGVQDPGGAASGQVYQDPPNNTVIQSADVSSLDVTLSVRASYPLVEIEGTPYTLSRAVGETHYSGDVDLTVIEGETVVTVQTPDDLDGARDTVMIALSVPPAIIALSFAGGYPGTQTELKENDSFDVTVTADKSFDQVVFVDHEACQADAIDVAPTLSTTVTGTIADRGDSAIPRPARVYVRDSVSGAFSLARDTNFGGGSADGVDVVSCNNLFPTVVVGSVTYPVSQSALKDSETATVVNTVSDYDTVVYTSPTSELNVADPTIAESPKTVQRIAGSYNVSIDNLQIAATRDANDAMTVDVGVVNIAHVVAELTASYGGARIRSGVTPGNDTVITLGSNQQMGGTPTMDPAASRGSFINSWTGGPTSWNRTLRVPDSENPADNSANAWINVSATNLAGIVTNSITTGPTYIVGGFAQRTLNYPPLTANSTETFPLTTEGNLSAGVFSNGNAAVVQPFGTPDTSDAGKEGWCAPTASSGAGTQMRMLHVPTVAANGAGLTLTLVEETA